MASTVQVGQGYGPPVPPYDSGVGLPMVGAPPGPPMAGPAAMPEPPPPPPPAPPESQPDITPADRIAVESALSDAANVGAQGAARPSMASEAQQRATNISRILEQQLLQQARPGFGDIISAALQTIQKPGQVDFATALRQAQNQDLTRSYNIANALAGLQRRSGQQEITPRDMLRIAEFNAARGDRRFRDLMNNVNSAAQAFEDPVAARETLMQGILQFDSPERSPVEVMNAAVAFARQQGHGSRQPRASAKDTGISEDIVKDPQTRLYTNTRGGRLLPWMVNYNALIKAGRFEEAEQVETRGLTGARPEASTRTVTEFENQVAGAEVAFDLMDRIRANVAQRGASIMGATGSLSQMVSGGLAQFAALTGINIDRPADELSADFNRRFFADPKISDRTKASFSWLQRDNSPAAQAFKSNMLVLGPTIAKALDPAGRLSNQDVQQALQIIGQSGANLLTDPRAVISALNEVEQFIEKTIEARRSRVSPITQRYPTPIQLRPARTATPSVQAPAPAAAPPAAGDPLEGRTARDASGNRIIRRNGRWEPIQ